MVNSHRFIQKGKIAFRLMGNTSSMQYFKTITNFPILNRLLIAEYAVYWSSYKSNGNIDQLKQNMRQKVKEKGQGSYNSIYGCSGSAHASLGKVEFSFVFSQEFNIFFCMTNIDKLFFQSQHSTLALILFIWNKFLRR